MVSRAAAALSVDTLTDTTLATGEHYAMESSKMSAALQAFLRLAREHRAYRRELMQDLAATQKEEAAQPRLGLPDRVRPLLKKAEGVLEDAIAYEKRRRAAAKAGVPFIEEEDERFYEEHGFYPARDEDEAEEAADEKERSDKDEQDGQDNLTPNREQQAPEVAREEGQSEKSFDTDDADREEHGKEAGAVQHGLSANGQDKAQEVEGQQGVMAVPP